MPSLVIVGAQWGDEGKGKIVDLLARKADIIARFQGGNNAGHTIILKEKEKMILHLIPSGIFHDDKICVIGNGVVVNPEVLCQEIELVRSKSFKVDDNLMISEKAHLIMPYHLAIEQHREAARGENKIGTTQRGIGPAYQDKVAREGFIAGDLLDPAYFKGKLKEILPRKNLILENVFNAKSFDLDEIYSAYMKHAEIFSGFIKKTSLFIHEAIKENKKVLFEGAQGSALDNDHGTYPFVTSSNTVSAQACIGTGVGPGAIDKVVGIFKAYTTRVGSGPFPTELPPSTAETIRKKGGEFGATTGRPRRCGWLDLVLLRHAIRTSGIDALCMNKIDVLCGLPRVGVCNSYKLKGKIIKDADFMTRELSQWKPVFEEREGWEQIIPEKIKKKSDLPKNALRYIDYIEEQTGVPIEMVSMGPERDQTVTIGKFF